MLRVAHADAAEAHHLFGQVYYAHRFAHIEQKHIAAFGQHRRLQHQLRGLRDGNEVADSSRIGEDDWSATCDLLRKRGTTEPEEPKSLPKRTLENRYFAAASEAQACTTSSAMRLLARITLVGRTALSVEISTTWRRPQRWAAWQTTRVESTLLAMPARGWASNKGTCL